MIWVAVVLGVLLAGVVAYILIANRRAKSDAPISIVVLRKTAAMIDASAVRGAVRRALKVDAQIEPLPIGDGVTTGFAILHDSLPAMCVINSARTYTEPGEYDHKVSFEDATVHEALRSHTAWVSADAMSDTPRSELPGAYAMLGRVIAEFIDNEALLLYQPAEQRFQHVSEEATAALAGGRAAELFGDDRLNNPMYKVETSDEAINKAIAEAQRRLPEFISAIERRGLACTPLFKARFTNQNDDTEVMWVQLTVVERGSLKGTVTNKARAPGLPSKGDEVSVPLDQVVDWAYLDDKGKPQGIFVDRLLTQR